MSAGKQSSAVLRLMSDLRAIQTNAPGVSADVCGVLLVRTSAGARISVHRPSRCNRLAATHSHYGRVGVHHPAGRVGEPAE